ncbi:MAG: hypothetical protein AAF531_10725 [Actinomycetota bacterium]
MTEHLDRAFASIMATMIETGEAPHYTELANDLGLQPDEGNAVIHQLMDHIPGWLHPGTDYIASFPPFNNQPTQYRIRIDGKPGWYGQ